MISLQTAISDAQSLVKGFLESGNDLVYLAVGNGKLYVGINKAESSTSEEVTNVPISSVDEVEGAFENFKKFWE